jgi:hypothetical protein
VALAQLKRQAAKNPLVPKRRLLKFLVLVAATVLPGCIYVPRTTQVFDPECQIASNHMVLQPVQVAAIQGCTNEGCVALIVGAGIATGASVIISGTIVVAGNVAYWFERRARCQEIRQR